MGADAPDEGAMRTTINLDEQLLGEAQRITEMKKQTALIQGGLRALTEREGALCLARLGGIEPRLRPIPGRRPEHA
jgi:Arc/MetJ family transcription regulator